MNTIYAMNRQRIFVLWIVRGSLCVIVFVVGWQRGLIVPKESITSTYGKNILIGPGQRYIYEKRIQPQRRLEGAFYEISDTKFIDRLREWSYMMPVLVQVERRQFDEEGESYDKLVHDLMMTPVNLLSDEGVGISFLHSKVRLVDSSAIIQSANISYQGLARNTELFLRTSDKRVVASIEYMLEQDRARRPIDIRKIDSDLPICPDTCRSSIEDAIESAERSIRIANQYITDQSVIALLEDRQRRGIAIQILVGPYQDMSAFSGTQIVDTVQIYTGAYLHMKSMLIDDRRLLGGSINFSTNAFDNNREVGLRVEEKETIRTFLERFSDAYTIS